MTEPFEDFDSVREWERVANYFVVEIQVGKAWVEHSREHTPDRAEAVLREALRDRSVSAVRVLEHKVTHVCDKRWEEQADTVVRLPAKFERTGGTAPCPLCGASSAVASDGANEWLHCSRCDRTLPI